MDYYFSIFIRNLKKDKFYDITENIEKFSGQLRSGEKDIILGRTDDINFISWLLQMRKSYPEAHFGFSQYLGLAKGLSKIAKPGEILISEEIEKKVIESCDITSLGMLSIEGMSSQILVCRIEKSVAKMKFPQPKPKLLQISRKGEVESLINFLKVAKAVLITGPVGCGKTTFLDQLAESWQERNIYRTMCPSWIAGINLKPIIEIVNQILGLSGIQNIEEKQKLIERRLKELEITDIGTSYLAVLDFLDLGEEESILKKLELKTRLSVITETIAEILRRLSWAKAIVVIIEDIENIDPSSANFIHHLTGKLIEDNIGFIFSSTLSQVNISGLKEFELREIEKERLAKLIKDWTGEEMSLPPTTPFHVSQYIAFYNEEKMSYFYHEYLGKTPITDFSVSFYDLKTIIKKRIELLDDQSEFLFNLAVAGVEINPDELPIDKKNQFLFDYFIKRYYIFTNPLLQREIYNLVPDKDKRHQRLADYYSRIQGYEEHAAFHYRAGANYKKAIEFLMKSGNLAVNKGGYESGINYYQQALELCRRQGESVNLELLVELNEGLADIYRALGDKKKALKYYKTVLDSYKEILKE